MKIKKKSIKKSKAVPMVKSKKIKKDDIMGKALKPVKKKKIISDTMPIDDFMGIRNQKASY